MEIVIEYVILENFLISLLLLKTTALLSKEKGRLFFISSLISSCATIVLPLFHLTTFGSFLFQIGLTFIYISISFKFKTLKKFFLLFICNFVSTLIFGGACFIFEQLFGITSVLIILLVCIFTYLLVKFVMKKYMRKRNIDNFCYDIEIENLGKKVQYKAFLDSGNLLFDPLTNNPVTLINFKVFSSLFDNIDIEDVLRKQPNKLKELKYAHYISFNTLNNNSKILVFQVDRILVGEKILEKPILGLSLQSFNSAFGTDVILHNNFALGN